MKLWKRLGAALVAVAALTSLTGPVLAAEPDSGIAVQMDGKALTFTDAAPEITNDRTFLPFRTVLESMGAEVDYDAQTNTVSAKRGGVELSMVPGQTKLVITENGETRTQEMDVAPYINPSNSRTYVPVRYAAEAFGYNVGWDQGSKTVILADVDALFGDATFELLESFSAYCEKQEANQNMSLTGNLALDLTDKSGETLTKPIQIKGSLEGVAGEKGIQLTGKMSAAGLDSLTAAPIWLQLLSDASAELRVDLETKTLYFCIPTPGTGENTWLSLDLGAYEAQLLAGLDMAQITQMEDASIREALVWVMKSLPLNDSAASYDTLKQMADLYVKMLSDQSFTQSGNTYTAKTTLEDMVNVEITLTKQGSDITAMDLTMTASAEEGGTKMTMTMTEHAAPSKVDMVMDMTMTDSEMDMSFHMDMACAPTDKAPQTQPPEGVTPIPIAAA